MAICNQSGLEGSLVDIISEQIFGIRGIFGYRLLFFVQRRPIELSSKHFEG